MKLKILGMIAGSALLGLQSTHAAARADVYVGLDIGIPVVVESRPVYYYDYEPVHYYEYREYPRYVYSPRYEVRYSERHRHDNGLHRGHHKHKHLHHHH